MLESGQYQIRISFSTIAGLHSVESTALRILPLTLPPELWKKSETGCSWCRITGIAHMWGESLKELPVKLLNDNLLFDIGKSGYTSSIVFRAAN
jgi:hypothetical protein